MKFLDFLKIFVLLAVFMTASLAQNQKSNDETQEIRLNITVTAKKGDWVSGLKAENFKIYDEKTLQPITFFSAEDVPISVGILVDKSVSAFFISRPEIQQALADFVNKSHSDNEYFLMPFNFTEGVLSSDFQDKTAILKSISNLSNVKMQGNTNLYDAVKAGMEKVSKGKHAKKVLLVLSDWMDNSSKADFGDIKKAVKNSDILFYNVTILDGRNASTVEGMQGQAFSDQIAQTSGGKGFYPQSHSEAIESFHKIAEELRKQYTIGFKMAEKEAKEKWREVEVKVELPANISNVGKVSVRSRKGYYLSAKGN